MILTPLWLIEIGNSTISVASNRALSRGRFREFADDEIPEIRQFIIKNRVRIGEMGIICSVVPKNEYKIRTSLRSFKNFKLLSMGVDIPVEIRSRYRNYKRLGMDRKVNAYGALRVMRPPLIVLDFGTATTIDFISKMGVFEGGMILPGIKASLDLLHEKTALLPQVRIRPVKRFLGNDTQSSMLCGVLRGYGAMVDGLVSQFRKKYGSHLKTLATGGLVDIVCKYSNGFNHVDRCLTLRSMAWIYEDWIRSRGRIHKR